MVVIVTDVEEKPHEEALAAPTLFAVKITKMIQIVINKVELNMM